MFFALSKILGFFAIPSNLVVSIGVLGLLLLPTRFARAGRALAFASLIVLAILGLSPAGNALIIPLEERFPRWDATRGAPDGIVVDLRGAQATEDVVRQEIPRQNYLHFATHGYFAPPQLKSAAATASKSDRAGDLFDEVCETRRLRLGESGAREKQRGGGSDQPERERAGERRADAPARGGR